MASILVVDDEEYIRRMLDRLLSGAEHTCTLAEGVAEAREHLAKSHFDLTICDVNMPGETGISLAEHTASEHRDTAVIMLTAVDDPRTAAAALAAGTYGYIIKPFNPNELLINIQSALRRRTLEATQRLYQQNLEQMVEERTVRLQGVLEGIIQALVQTVESRDPYTAGHQDRVAGLAVALAEDMHSPKDLINGLQIAARIHDLGKISVPAEILSKPTRLTDIEFALLKTHPQVGHDILKNTEFPWPIAQIVQQHHERVNGSGYPLGLSGESILPEARILCVADVVEAMASHRPYRPKRGIDVVLKEISDNAGILYDPEVAKVCLRMICVGTPFLEINKQAVQCNADMVVMGSRGNSGEMKDIFFGSTTERVLRFIKRPVLCVPLDDGNGSRLKIYD